MSYVHNVILVSGCGEYVEQDNGPDRYPAVEFIDAWLAENHRGGTLAYVGDRSNGGKALECEVWVGGFNYLDVQGLIEVVRAAPWDNPDCVQLFVKEQEDDLFTERLRSA